MKKIILLLLTGFFSVSCDNSYDDEIITPPDGVSFQIEKTNSTNNYTSSTNISTLIQKSSSWSKDYQGNLHYISKSILYDLTLANGEIIKFSLEFSKHSELTDTPTINLLTLDGTGNSGLGWDYISSQTEAVDFYQNSNLSVHIGEYNVIWLGNTNESNLVTVETVLVNGVEKSRVTVNFNGSARGYYDPNGEYMEVYNLTNGVFRGVVE
jgi:hypothetical protein